MWDALSRTLEGQVVVLEPLAPEHEARLRDVARDARIWEASNYLLTTRERFAEWWRAAVDEQRERLAAPFAILERATGAIVGSTRYATLSPEHRSLEIGWTWLAPRVWRMGVNVESKYLMLRRAFEEVGCIRVAFKANAGNSRSRGALAALPAQFEGIHRKHRIIRDGEVRDSAWYSIVDDEWPDVRANLERRLAKRS